MALLRGVHDVANNAMNNTFGAMIIGDERSQAMGERQSSFSYTDLVFPPFVLVG